MHFGHIGWPHLAQVRLVSILGWVAHFIESTVLRFEVWFRLFSLNRDAVYPGFPVSYIAVEEQTIDQQFRGAQ